MAGFLVLAGKASPRVGLTVIHVEKIKNQVEKSVQRAAAALEKKDLNIHLVGRHPLHVEVAAIGVKNLKRGKKDEKL